MGLYRKVNKSVIHGVKAQVKQGLIITVMYDLELIIKEKERLGKDTIGFRLYRTQTG